MENAALHQFTDQQVAFVIEWLRVNTYVFDVQNQQMWRSLISAVKEQFNLPENFISTTNMVRAYWVQIDLRLNEFFGTSVAPIRRQPEEEVEDFRLVNMEYSQRFEYIRSIYNYNKQKYLTDNWRGLEVGQVQPRDIAVREVPLKQTAGACPLEVYQCRKPPSLFRSLHFVILRDTSEVMDVLLANALEQMIKLHGGQTFSWYTPEDQQENLRHRLTQENDRLIFVCSQYEAINNATKQQYPSFAIIPDSVIKTAIKMGEACTYETLTLCWSSNWEKAP